MSITEIDGKTKRYKDKLEVNKIIYIMLAKSIDKKDKKREISNV